MLRNIIFYLIFIPATFILSAGLILVPRCGDAIMRTWSSLAIRLSGLKIETDLSALDPKKNYIFMVNHQSQFDIPLVVDVLKAFKLRFVAKKELFQIPVFGKALETCGHIAIDRSNRRKAMKSIERAVKAVEEGTSIVIFPEGTRSTDFSKLHEFKVGGMILALKTGAPVAPIVCHGTGDALPKKKIFIRPGTVRIKALPVIDAGEKYSLKEREAFRDDLYEAMNRAYTEMLDG